MKEALYKIIDTSDNTYNQEVRYNPQATLPKVSQTKTNQDELFSIHFNALLEKYFFIENIGSSTSVFRIPQILRHYNDQLYYSVDDCKTWIAAGSNDNTYSDVELSPGQRIWVKGYCNWSVSNIPPNQILPYATAPYKIGGNILSIYFGDNVNKQYVPTKEGSSQFMEFFANHGYLRDASDLILPLNVSTQYMLYNLFYNCNNLLFAPKLRFTELERQCCSFMFNNCILLEIAPILPVVDILQDNNCYFKMFNNCINLKWIENNAWHGIKYCAGSTENVSQKGTYIITSVQAYTLGDYDYVIPEGWAVYLRDGSGLHYVGIHHRPISPNPYGYGYEYGYDYGYGYYSSRNGNVNLRQKFPFDFYYETDNSTGFYIINTSLNNEINIEATDYNAHIDMLDSDKYAMTYSFDGYIYQDFPYAYVDSQYYVFVTGTRLYFKGTFINNYSSPRVTISFHSRTNNIDNISFITDATSNDNKAKLLSIIDPNNKTSNSIYWNAIIPKSVSDSIYCYYFG